MRRPPIRPLIRLPIVKHSALAVPLMGATEGPDLGCLLEKSVRAFSDAASTAGSAKPRTDAASVDPGQQRPIAAPPRRVPRCPSSAASCDGAPQAGGIVHMVVSPL